MFFELSFQQWSEKMGIRPDSMALRAWNKVAKSRHEDIAANFKPLLEVKNGEWEREVEEMKPRSLHWEYHNYR